MKKETVEPRELLKRFELKCLARDKNGQIFGYSQMPNPGVRGWQLTVKGDVIRLDQLFDIRDMNKQWMQSLISINLMTLAEAGLALKLKLQAKKNGAVRTDAYVKGLLASLTWKGQGLVKTAHGRYDVRIKQDGVTRSFGNFPNREKALAKSEEVYAARNKVIAEHNQKVIDEHNRRL